MLLLGHSELIDLDTHFIEALKTALFSYLPELACDSVNFLRL